MAAQRFYDRYFAQYLTADADARKASKEHWLKCHRKNLASGRGEMIIFSAQILAMQAMADKCLAVNIVPAEI